MPGTIELELEDIDGWHALSSRRQGRRGACHRGAHPAASPAAKTEAKTENTMPITPKIAANLDGTLLITMTVAQLPPGDHNTASGRPR